MDLIKQYLLKDQQPRELKEDNLPFTKIKFPCLPETDICLKYKPFYDYNSFLSELEQTESQIINYMPAKIRIQQNQFRNISIYGGVTFWVSNILFITFCHKISLIHRLLGDKTWKMFGFKGLIFGIPLYYSDQFLNLAQEDNRQKLFKQISLNYKRYKCTGDILELNPELLLEGAGLQE